MTIIARSAKVTVRAASVSEVSAKGGSLTRGPSGLVVGGGAAAITVVVPDHTDIVVGAVSGKVVCEGLLGAVTVTASSSNISIEMAERIDARSASGRIDVGTCQGECNALSKSGAIRIGRVGSADVSAVSGKVTVGDAEHANVRCVSGSVSVATTSENPDIKVRTVSGGVEVVVPRDASPRTNLRAKIRSVDCECESGDKGFVDVESLSGRIRVVCAR